MADTTARASDYPTLALDVRRTMASTSLISSDFAEDHHPIRYDMGQIHSDTESSEDEDDLRIKQFSVALIDVELDRHHRSDPLAYLNALDCYRPVNERDRDLLNREYIRQYGPPQSDQTVKNEHVREQPNGMNRLDFLPLWAGIHFSDADDRGPTIDAPELPIPPAILAPPRIQKRVGHVAVDPQDHGNPQTWSSRRGLHDLCGLSANIRVISKTPGYAFFVESTDQHLQQHQIYLDEGCRTSEQLTAILEELRPVYLAWLAEYGIWERRVLSWRSRRRAAELKYWKHQVDAKNWSHFEPEIEWQDHDLTYKLLQAWVEAGNGRDHKYGVGKKCSKPLELEQSDSIGYSEHDIERQRDEYGSEDE